MAFWSPLVLASLSLLPIQSPDLTQRTAVDKLESISATLERLEKGQNQLIALVRIQIDETRVAAFETQRQPLLAQEQQLTAEIGKLSASAREAANGRVTLARVPPDQPGMMVPANTSDPARQTEATRKLEDVRASLRAIDQSVAALKSRIAAWEKYLDEAGR